MLESNSFTFEMTGAVAETELSPFAYYVDAFGLASVNRKISR